MTRHLILLLVLRAPASCGAESPLGPRGEAEVNGLVNGGVVGASVAEGQVLRVPATDALLLRR